jgi:hypothetical protein
MAAEWTPNPRPPTDTSRFQEHRGWFQKQIVLLICAVTPKCPEVARILSLGMDKPLSLRTRIQLRIHFLMCSFCERYAKHLQYIRTAACHFPGHAHESSNATLPSETKARLKEALKKSE